MPKGQDRTPRKANRQRGLTKAEVLDTALRVLDERGAEAFSVRQVARALDVYPATIYWHVRGNRDDLLAEVGAHALADSLPQTPTGTWQDDLRAIFAGYRQAMQRHPNLAPLMGANMATNGTSGAALVERILAALTRAGFSGRELADHYNATLAAIVGFVTLELASAPADPGWAEALRDDLAALDPGQYPLLCAALPEMTNRAFVLRWENGAVHPLDGGHKAFVEAFLAGLTARGSP